MAESANKLLKNRYFLYVTAFFTGMSVMAAEIGASRLIAPFFSSSQIVWTIIIGVIMIALAIGYVWGGRLADKQNDPSKLYLRILYAAIWLALIPFLGKYVIAVITLALALFVSSNFLVIATFICCIVLFVFPLVLLGTVSPALIKLSATNLTENGKVVGELGALNTVGCILGTFLPTFVTIPAIGTSGTFLVFAFILAAISLSFFIAEKKYIIRNAVATVLIMVMIFVPFQTAIAFWDNSVLYEGESVYNYLQISEDENNYYFRTHVAVGIQSMKSKSGNNDGWYYSMALAAPLLAGITPVASAEYTEQINDGKKVLILGLAMGTYCELVYKYYGTGVEIIGVEIDKKIVDLARGEYFELSDSVEAVVTDGRAFLAYNNSEKYDVIIVDAYQDITIPFYMCTHEFFTLVKDHLTDEGILAINLNMRAEQEGNINDYLIDTVSKSFGGSYIYKVDVPNSYNSILYIGNSGENLKEKLHNELTGYDPAADIARFKEIEERMSECIPKNKYFFTDDKAPVELIGSRIIDSLIADGLNEFRQLLKERGFWGLVLDYIK